MAEINEQPIQPVGESDPLAKSSATLVMSKLVDSLVSHFAISRAESRKIMREVLTEL